MYANAFLPHLRLYTYFDLDSGKKITKIIAYNGSKLMELYDRGIWSQLVFS